MGISVETLALAKAFTKEYVSEIGGVKEIYEYTDIAYFPEIGEAECLYVDTSTGKIYRWSGSIYVELSNESLREFEKAENNGKVLGIVNGKFAPVEQTENPLEGMDVAANNGKVIGVVNGEFAPVEQTENPLEGMDAATNNGKVIGVVNGEFAPVEQTRDPLAGLDIAANNDKVIVIKNAAFTVDTLENLIPNGDAIQY